MSCVSSAEALTINATGLLALAGNGREVLRARRQGLSPVERRQRAHDANARFLRSMGLDPEEVLGPRPRTQSEPLQPEGLEPATTLSV